MIVDDSAVVRGLLSRWVGEAAGLEVVAAAPNGRAALDALPSAAPDIVILDLDMPEMDGVTTLPLVLAARPGVSVVVVSTLTQRSAEISLRCLRLGAVDCIPKPSGLREITLATSFRAELIAKLQGLAARHVPVEHLPSAAAPFRALRSRAAPRPRVLVIGASTGGPRAVIDVVKGLGPTSRTLPILVVQHMPPIFTTVFAQQIEAETGVEAHEAQDGELLVPGRVLVAPGGRHLGLSPVAGGVATRLDDTVPVHHCRPAVDVLLRDVEAVFGGAALVVVLTGMGSDGLDGVRPLARSGATILVQDQATSVVWGMPGSIARAGLATEVLPLAFLSGAIEAHLRRDVPLAAAAR